MTLKSFWRQDGISPIIGEDALVQYLLKKENGIVFLSTVPSSDGETRIVQAMARENEGKAFYCCELIEQLIDIIKKPHDRPPVDELCNRLRKYPVITVRFVNRIYGRTSTMQSLSQICAKLSDKSLIVVTGDYLEQYVPELLQQLPQAEKYYICY